MENEVVGIYGLPPAQQMFFVRCFMPDETGMRQAGMSLARSEQFFCARNLALRNGKTLEPTAGGVLSLLAVRD